MAIFDEYMKAVKGGQFVSVVSVKRMRTKKNVTSEVVKQSEFTCRAGVEYDNMAKTDIRRESGEAPAQNAGLPWGEWEEYPYSIRHKGKRYLRFSEAAGTKTKSRDFLDGKEVSADDVRDLCYASEFRARGDGGVFNLAEDNIAEMKVSGNTIEAK